jgi:hypothetical protein
MVLIDGFYFRQLIIHLLWGILWCTEVDISGVACFSLLSAGETWQATSLTGHLHFKYYYWRPNNAIAATGQGRVF